MTRIAFHLAPALMLAYGIVRLIDGRDGQHGPGPAWTIGHLLFLASLILYAWVIAGLHTRTRPTNRIAAGITTTVAAFGLLMFVRVAVLDIIVGLKAADAAEKSTLADQYADVPAVLPQAIYEIGPAFFMLGLLALLIHLTIVTPTRKAVAAPVLVTVGFAAITANLDLLPAGAALIWLALAPITHNHTIQLAPKPHAPA